ncbi:ALA-interacting subunit 5 [Perilla frutescens var. hirtella]|uniref:ALA-interacting subunit n=1 Tax=Perilla frutescens var. hirtella TaxID=608512 RepID=A0AAD4IR98_PERFH|nr:ALA-interacting subunit 5 [Perilla frutescens var. hirtella]KAH6819862.1 ALA-interacting subunit 5 [Perilla frutescens var. hirtella]
MNCCEIEKTQVVELVHRYDEDCIPVDSSNPDAAYKKRIGFIQDDKTDKTCIRTLTIPKKMKHPIFVYYQLDQFYQNHRRYVKSRNDEQYRNPSAGDHTGNCEPEARNSQDQPIVPCGLIAWSLFNDTYSLSRNDIALPINKKVIAWESDKTHKFGSNVYPKNFQNKSQIGGGKLDESIPLSEQDDLLVWMRTAALPNFRKLYGRIETDLEVNEVYIIVGGICLLIALAFIIVYLMKPRPLGDPSYLSWNRNPASVQ